MARQDNDVCRVCYGRRGYTYRDGKGVDRFEPCKACNGTGRRA